MRRLKYGIGFLGIFLLFASYRIAVGPFFSYCIEHDHTRLAKIIAPIANPGYKNNDFDENLLHTAAAQGSPELVEVLLQKGMDPNGRDRGGNTPLINAAASCEEQNEETRRKIDLLLDHGADIWACDKEGNSVFYHAAGNLDCLKYLISRCPNFDPFVVNYGGENLLFGAIKHERNDDPTVLQFLLSQGLDPNSLSFERSHLPLEEACDSSFDPHPRLVRTLLEAGAQYGSLAEFNRRHSLTPKIFEILKSYEDRQSPEIFERLKRYENQQSPVTGNTSEVLVIGAEEHRIREEEYNRHQPPCQSAYDIKMRRYYDYKQGQGACVDYGYAGPHPEPPEVADLKEMYEAEMARYSERGKTVTRIKWAFQILFGG